MSDDKLFDFPKLETVEIDVNKKIFKINGIDFGHRCSGFDIYCDTENGFIVRMEVKTTVTFANYDLKTGEMKNVSTIEK